MTFTLSSDRLLRPDMGGRSDRLCDSAPLPCALLGCFEAPSQVLGVASRCRLLGPLSKMTAQSMR